MKYLLLIYSNPKNWAHPTFMHPRQETSPEVLQTKLRDFEALMRELTESGELLTAEPLAEPGLAKVVRVRDGAPTVTDGPYAETKEHLAGVFYLECASPERVIDIASRFPDAADYFVEVRPIMNLRGIEM